MKNVLCFILAASCALSATAEEATTTKMDSSELTFVESSNDNPSGWVPFIGMGISAVDYNQSLNALDGVAGNVRVNMAYYTLPVVFDLGLGFDSADLNTTVDSGLFELATRYRFGSSKKWQIGPVANVNFGDKTGNKYASNTENFASFAGLQFARDFAVGQTGILRAGLKGMTDIGISNTDAQKYLFELQYGYTSTPTQVTQTHKVEEPVAQIEEEKVEIVQEARATVIERLVTVQNPQSLYFDRDADTIGPKNRAYLQKMVGLLNANRDNVREVVLTGYTDATVEPMNNSKLAFHRAIQIKAELQKAGLDKGIAVSMINGGELTRMEVANDLRRARRVDVDVTADEQINQDLAIALEAILRKN